MDFLTGFYDGSDPVSAAAGGVSNRAQVFKRTDRERDAAVGNRNLIDPAGGLPEMEHDHLFFYAGVAHGADGVVHQVGDDRQQGCRPIGWPSRKRGDSNTQPENRICFSRHSRTFSSSRISRRISPVGG